MYFRKEKKSLCEIYSISHPQRQQKHEIMSIQPILRAMQSTIKEYLLTNYWAVFLSSLSKKIRFCKTSLWIENRIFQISNCSGIKLQIL